MGVYLFSLHNNKYFDPPIMTTVRDEILKLLTCTMMVTDNLKAALILDKFLKIIEPSVQDNEHFGALVNEGIFQLFSKIQKGLNGPHKKKLVKYNNLFKKEIQSLTKLNTTISKDESTKPKTTMDFIFHNRCTFKTVKRIDAFYMFYPSMEEKYRSKTHELLRNNDGIQIQLENQLRSQEAWSLYVNKFIPFDLLHESKQKFEKILKENLSPRKLNKVNKWNKKFTVGNLQFYENIPTSTTVSLPEKIRTMFFKSAQSQIESHYVKTDVPDSSDAKSFFDSICAQFSFVYTSENNIITTDYLVKSIKKYILNDKGRYLYFKTHVAPLWISQGNRNERWQFVSEYTKYANSADVPADMINGDVFAEDNFHPDIYSMSVVLLVLSKLLSKPIVLVIVNADGYCERLRTHENIFEPILYTFLYRQNELRYVPFVINGKRVFTATDVPLVSSPFLMKDIHQQTTIHEANLMDGNFVYPRAA
jgi:hypothetical protein